MVRHLHPRRVKYKLHTIALTALMLIFTLELIGTVFYMWAEKWSLIDSLYFTTTTLTTIGFGDLVPAGPIAKLFTVFFSFAGVGTVLFSVTAVAEYYFREKIEQISHVEDRLRDMAKPERIKKSEEKMRKEEREIEEKKRKIAKEEEDLKREEEELKREEEEVEAGKKQIKKIVEKIK